MTDADVFVVIYQSKGNHLMKNFTASTKSTDIDVNDEDYKRNNAFIFYFIFNLF